MHRSLAYGNGKAFLSPCHDVGDSDTEKFQTQAKRLAMEAMSAEYADEDNTE
jgi:hypothetical protein